MSIPNATLQAIIQAYQGFALSEQELDLVRPELDNYCKALEDLRDLDLSNVLSGRLLHVQEGGQA